MTNNTTKISISDVKSELEMLNLKEFRAKKAEKFAFLQEKLQLRAAEMPDYDNSTKLNTYKQLKKYLSNAYDFKYDIVGNSLYYSPKGENEFELLDEMRLTNELYEQDFTRFDMQLQAILQSEIIEKFDVFLDYFFDFLPEWTPDKPDYIGQLCKHIETTDDALFRFHFQKHLIRSIACSLTWIAFNKHCFVLYGKQNDGKSYFVRFLCPNPLPIKENLDMQSKDSRFALAKYFVINLDEMQALQKNDVDKIKNYMTTSKITDRVIYQKKDSNFPRRANFYGTTNNEEILTDTTGNVRFLIFEILGIKHDNGGENGYKGSIDIDNVYAQAFYYFITGQKTDYELTPAEIIEMEKRNRQFMTTTPEMDLVVKYFSPAKKTEEHVEYLRNTEILSFIQKSEGVKLGTKRLGQALKYYGFKKKAINDANRGDKYCIIRNIC